jgi:hypothetical protein
VRATSGFVRLFIRGLAWDAEDKGSAFADTLKAASRARLTDSAKGKVLTGTGSGGTSVQFTLPPLGDLTAGDVAEVCAKLLDAVDAIKAESPNVTDTQLVSLLLAQFPTIRAAHFQCGLRR